MACEDDPVESRSRTRSTCTALRRATSSSVVDEYLHAARDAGFTQVRLIHGRGKGVQRADIQRLLRDHPLVERYWDAPESHLGATLVRLRRATGRLTWAVLTSGNPAIARAIASSWPLISEARSVDTGTPEFTADATVR